MLETLVKKLSQKTMTELLKNGRLDEYYGDILEAIDWLNKIENLHPNSKPYTDIKQKLNLQREHILIFYQKYFNTHSVIGSKIAYNKPDLIFALACRGKEMVSMRLEGALPFAQRHEDARLILCGGGFDPVYTEAQIMQQLLVKKNFPRDRVVFEEDSIDAIGNALFSKLKLKQQNLLPQKARLLVVTSAFHAVRSFNILRKVYGPNYDIAVAPVKTVFDNDRQIKLVAHELASDNLSSRQIFSLRDFADIEGGMGQMTPGDHKSIFFQLILYHDFYRHRYDLVRKYVDVVKD